MVLSGPAASIFGALALTGTEDALVVDMGGTTSDVARLVGGRPRHSNRGAVVGGHRTTVRAPALQTIGLGGDSRIQIDRFGEITVGPRRVLPLCVVAKSEPAVTDLLHELHETPLAELSLLPAAELFVLLREPSRRQRLSERARRIVEILRKGPTSILGLSRGLEYPYLSCIDTEELESSGIVIRSGFTPTDLLHIEGEMDRWDVRASKLALEHLAARYGTTPEDFARLARRAVERNLVRVIVSTGMELDGPETLDERRLSSRLFESASSGKADGIVTTSLSLGVPVIGIGAPAHSFVPNAARTLGVDAVIPSQAGVAGAVGAITGSVVESVTVLIRPTPVGFTVHAPDEARPFALLDTARSFACERAVDLVRRKALGSGADRFFIRLDIENREATIGDGGRLYIETQVRAEAAGAPRVAVGTADIETV